jgi:GT2 family glycosyltransferase
MKLNIENITYNGLLNISGWLFDENNSIKSVKFQATSSQGVDVREAIWGFVRNDVYADNQFFEASLKSGFHVYGLIAAPAAQIDLNLTLSNGHSIDLPLTLVEIIETNDGDGHVQLHPLLPIVSPQPHLSKTRIASYDLAQEIDRFFAPQILEPSLQSQELVNVLVSVYRGMDFLEPFFNSIFADPGHPFELTVVDNGNDDPEVVNFLNDAALRYGSQMRLVRVEKNEGYIKGICAAYEAAPPGRHVVVLNTDLVLPPQWLARLIAPLLNRDDIATVTPFTNAGTVCSFPIIGEDNPLFKNIPVEDVDRSFQSVQCRDGIDIPSGVGFCMAMNKEVIARIGYFDSETYGFGYGEENDWSLKAHRLGFRNILMPTMYVWHKHGGVYLAEEKRQLIAKNMKIINAKFPEYHNMVRRHFAEDSVGPLRSLIAAKISIDHLGKSARAVLVNDDHRPATALKLKNDVCDNGGVCIWIRAKGEINAQIYLFTKEISSAFHTASAEATLRLFDALNVSDLTVYGSFKNVTATETVERVKKHNSRKIPVFFEPGREL